MRNACFCLLFHHYAMRRSRQILNFSKTNLLCIATTFSMNEIHNYEKAYDNAFYWPMFQRWCIWCKCIFLRFCKILSVELPIFSCLRESVMFTFKEKIYVTQKSAWHHQISVKKILMWINCISIDFISTEWV